MKKTGTKAFANLIASILLLAFEIWAYVQTLGFKVVKKAAVQPAAFPQIMSIGMMIFTAVLLIQSILKLATMKETDPLAEPAETINFVKNRGVLAAIGVILLCVFFTACFKSLGYVVVSAIVSATIMWVIGKRNVGQILFFSIVVPLVMWLIFYKGLTVNIPMGLLQPIRDLVDMI